MKWMKKNRLWFCFLALAGALLVMGYGVFSLSRLPGHFQHLWLPPAQKQIDATEFTQPTVSNGGLQSVRETVEALRSQLEGACDRLTLYAVASPASVSVEEGPSVSARLEGLSGDGYALRPMALFGGRLIYPEEFDRGDRVAMMDEQLAVALFQYAEPLERNILIAGESYRIVGIVRDHKQVGDRQDYSLYVPFRAVERSSLTLTALCLEASPVPGSGGWAAFTAAIQSQSLGGTTLNLQKERMNATLPLRLLAVAAGFATLLVAVRFLNGQALAFYRRYKERLVNEYAARLLPWSLGRCLLLGLGYAGVLFAFAQLFMLLVNPVFTFPEWVPAVLVEPKDISAAFWNVWQGMADVMALRSPEVLRIGFFARLLSWSAGVAALCGGVLWGRVTGRGQGT